MHMMDIWWTSNDYLGSLGNALIASSHCNKCKKIAINIICHMCDGPSYHASVFLIACMHGYVF